MVAPVGVAPVGGSDCVTARPLGEGAEVKISPIPGSVMVHARKLAASRMELPDMSRCDPSQRDMELIARPALGTKA